MIAFAHFARVTGMDWNTGEIYLEDSLNLGGDFWTVSFDDFMVYWFNPEENADRIPEGVVPEPVEYWSVEVDPRYE